MTLQYDFVFLALLLEALEGSGKPRLRTRRCGAHPLKKRKMLTDDAALTYCAFSSALLTYYRAEDELRDNRGIKRSVVRMTMPVLRHMRRRCRDFDALERTIREQLQTLSVLEREKCPYADEVADCFGVLLRAVFAAGCRNANNQRIAGEIGYHVGKWIYLADAADDYPRDCKEGTYNPLLAAGKTRDAARLPAEERAALADAMRLECRAAVRALDLGCFDAADTNGAILYHILYLGMPRRADEILAHPGKNRQKDRHGEIGIDRNADENDDEKSGETNE